MGPISTARRIAWGNAASMLGAMHATDVRNAMDGTPPRFIHITAVPYAAGAVDNSDSSQGRARDRSRWQGVVA